MRRCISCIALAAAMMLTLATWGQAAKASKGKDDSKSAQSSSIEELITKGDYQKAIDLANKFIEANQATEGLYIDLGVAYYHMKDYPKAIEAYEKAAGMNPFDTKALQYEATCYHEMNQDDKVEEVYNRILGIDGTQIEVRYDLAQLYEKQDKLSDALAQYQQIYKVDPNFKDVAYAAGVILHNDGKYEEAAPFFEKAVSLKPDDDQALLAQGQNFLKDGKLEMALAPLKSFIDVTKNEPIKPSVIQQVAVIYEKLGVTALDSVKGSKDKAAVSKAEADANGHFGNAVVYFDKLLAIRPNSETALAGKANCLLKMDKADEALPVLKQYLEVSGNTAEKKKVADIIKQIEASNKRR